MKKRRRGEVVKHHSLDRKVGVIQRRPVKVKTSDARKERGTWKNKREGVWEKNQRNKSEDIILGARIEWSAGGGDRRNAK